MRSGPRFQADRDGVLGTKLGDGSLLSRDARVILRDGRLFSRDGRAMPRMLSKEDIPLGVSREIRVIPGSFSNDGRPLFRRLSREGRLMPRDRREVSPEGRFMPIDGRGDTGSLGTTGRAESGAETGVDGLVAGMLEYGLYAFWVSIVDKE